MTREFASAGHTMSRVLGRPDYRFATIAHPISSASEDGLHARARAAAVALQRIVLDNGERKEAALERA